jgi:hypothetical protein
MEISRPNANQASPYRGVILGQVRTSKTIADLDEAKNRESEMN